MDNTIANRSAAMHWQKRYDVDAPKVGEIAPDFELHDANGQNPVRLSGFRQTKPVALVFGSFT